MNIARRLILSTVLVGLTATSIQAGNLKVPKDYPTIQAAVDAAVPGDRIVVSKGVYAPVTIQTEGLSLIGKKGAVIDAGSGTGIHLSVGNFFLIRGMTVINADIGISLYASYFGTVENCRVSDGVPPASGGSGSTGIRVEASLSVQLKKNSIKRVQLGAHILNSNACVLQKNKMADVVTGVAIQTSEHTTVRLNRVARSSGYGIYLGDSRATVVDSNNVRDSGAAGIAVEGLCASSQVLGNHIRGVLGAGGTFGGIVSGSYGLTIQGNLVEESSEYGIRVVGHSCLVADNRIRKSAGHGLSLASNASFNLVLGNKVEKSDYGFHVLGGQNFFNGNRARKNQSGAILKGGTGNEYHDNTFDS